jgi:replication factor A2
MQDEKKKGSRNQSIIPVTSAIIHGANHTGDNEFELDGVQLSLVILVGEIVSVNESQTNVVYKVDDRTGPLVDVKKWLDDQESEAELNQRAECREGIFVKVIGHIRTFSQQRSLVSYLIQPIRDFNAVTHHMVSVVHSQLSLKKGPVVPEQFANLTSVTPAAGPSGSTWGNPQATSTPGFFGGRVDSGMSQIQQTVLNTISQCKMDQGISMSDLIRNVGSKGFNEKNIRTAVDFLCNEGHVYSTIDDEHFKSTDA